MAQIHISMRNAMSPRLPLDRSEVELLQRDAERETQADSDLLWPAHEKAPRSLAA